MRTNSILSIKIMMFPNPLDFITPAEEIRRCKDFLYLCQYKKIKFTSLIKETYDLQTPLHNKDVNLHPI